MKKNLFTGLVLAIFAIICGGLLAGVNALTSPIIEKARQTKIGESLKIAYPEIDTSIHNIDIETNENVDTLYIIKNKADSSKLAAIYIISEMGFKDEIQMMIGVDKDGKVTGYKVILQNETKGNITVHDFQMTEKDSLDSFDALAGSTVSSNAVKRCFEIAFEEAEKDLG